MEMSQGGAPIHVRQKLPSPIALLKSSLSFYSSQWETIILISSAPLLLFAPQLFFESRMPGFSVVFGFIALAVSFFSRLALLGFIVGREATASNIWGAYRYSFRVFFPYLLISFFTGAAVIGGLLLFVIPGIYLSIRLGFSYFAFFADDRRGLSALFVSWQYTRGYWWAIVWRVFVFLILMLVVSFPFAFFTGGIDQLGSWGNRAGAGSPFFDFLSALFTTLVVAPLVMLYWWNLFMALKTAHIADAVSLDETKFRKWIIALIILASIGALALIAVAGFYIYQFLYLIIPGGDFMIPGSVS